MIARRLGALLEGAGVVPLDRPGSDPEISGLRVDSRLVEDGDLFFALRGARADGARFVADAVARGARAIVCDGPRADVANRVAWVRVSDPRRAVGLLAREWFGRPDAAMTLVGLTGTNGKTTVSYLVESIVRAAGLSAGRIGTVAYAFAGVETPAQRTTPEATEMYALLARMREAGTDIVAIEVSSHALALERVAGARFAVAAFLNLGRDHLDFHETMEAYFEAKARLFVGLESRDTAVLASDDPRSATIAPRTRARLIRFGRGPTADVRIQEETVALEGGTARLETPSGPIHVCTPLTGRFNLDNAAAAAACGIALGLDPEAIARGIASLSKVPGRLERVDAGQPFCVFVDYAHTEDALAATLETLRPMTSGRLGVVFGCGGDRDRGKRPGMGRAAARGADALWVTSDNPRSEDPLSIIDDVLRGVADVAGASPRARVAPDRAEAIASAIRWAGPGDTVLVAGKGHETTQTFATHVEPFDDRVAASNALARRGWGSR